MIKKRIHQCLLILLSVSIGGGLMSFMPGNENRPFKTSKNLEIFAALFKELDMFYVDTLDIDKVIQRGVDGMLSTTDPYTSYYPEDEVSTLKEMITGKYGGIGAAIRCFEGDNYVTIMEPMEGLPAQQVGVKAGDIILSIGGKEMKRGNQKEPEFTGKVSDALRGEPGTTFVLRVKRPQLKDSIVKEFKITRKNIRQSPIPYAGMLKGDIAYISFAEFTENSAKDFKKSFIELKQKGAKKLIIDLRGNGGGSLTEAVEIVNLFVPKGLEIVATRGKIKATDRVYYTTGEPVDLEIPICVLVDGGTASSAEIVSGSLQDLDRAVIVGERTFGKGLVQMTRDLPYNGQLKVTTGKYYIPSGRCIQAIDYSKKNADGTVSRIADSLTTVFRTVAGRPVRDGGGIRPDVEVKGERIPNIVFYLANSPWLSQYVTRYCLTHTEPKEVAEVHLSDEDYATFKTLLVEKKFTYDRQSVRFLDRLKELAEAEGYSEDTKIEFEALQKKLNHDLSRDLESFSKPIKELIETEIITRYFYRRGVALRSLEKSKEMDKAVELLNDAKAYAEILAPPAS